MKNSENQSEIAACEQKTTSEKANFRSNTIRFSFYLKIRARKFYAAKPLVFFAPFPVSAWPKSPLQFHFKNHGNVWTDIEKKETASQYNSNSLNCKNSLNCNKYVYLIQAVSEKPLNFRWEKLFAGP